MKESSPRSDLEERTFQFAKNVRAFIKKLPRSMLNRSDCDQLLRSSGSIGANYIEAQEAMSKKDFGMRVKICRKEAKESKYWLALFNDLPDSLTSEYKDLHQEAAELTKIFSSIVEKVRV